MRTIALHPTHLKLPIVRSHEPNLTIGFEQAGQLNSICTSLISSVKAICSLPTPVPTGPTQARRSEYVPWWAFWLAGNGLQSYLGLGRAKRNALGISNFGTILAKAYLTAGLCEFRACV